MKKLALEYLKIKIPKEYKNLVMDEILKNNLTYKSANILNDFSLELTISNRNTDTYKKLFSKKEIPAEFGESNGILPRLSKYKNRYGLIIGIIIMLFGVYASSLFVWRIDIEGNTSVSNEEILEILEDSGCTLGTFIPKIDYDTVHNRFLLNSEKISWISVNIKGNVAKVLVKERLYEEENKNTTYTNVISKYDAQISLIQLYNGKKVVSIGDVVKKGDLLISGIMNSQSQGVRYEHADGIVMGYVNKPIFVKIPLKTTQKIYTGKNYKQKSVKIFSKSINFSLKYRNYDEFCDKIESSERVCLFGKIKLPIEICTTEYKEYEIVDKTYTLEQAVDVAFVELRKELDIATESSELISKDIKTYYDEHGVYIDCNLYCLENIAMLVKFDVE